MKTETVTFYLPDGRQQTFNTEDIVCVLNDVRAGFHVLRFRGARKDVKIQGEYRLAADYIAWAKS